MSHLVQLPIAVFRIDLLVTGLQLIEPIVSVDSDLHTVERTVAGQHVPGVIVGIVEAILLRRASEVGPTLLLNSAKAVVTVVDTTVGAVKLSKLRTV